MPRPSATGLFTTGLLLLTAATGAIDAVSYLALDRVFTGNMTGNVLFVAFAFVGVDDIPLLNNVLALVGFGLGSMLGGRIVGRGHPVGLPRTSAWVLVAGTALILALTGWWTLAGDIGGTAQATLTALLATLMGAQVAAVKPVGNSDITTVVVTNTLANLTRESRLGGGSQTSHQWRHRFLAVVAMGAGAGLGAVCLKEANGPVALLVAGGVFALGALALVAGNRAQHRQDATTAPSGAALSGR